MDYQKIYNNIINNRKQNIYNGYTEKHHIIPKSLGGKDNKDNLVELSAREHFICHLLLTKMYPEGSVELIKMIKAFMCMMFRQSDMQKRYLNSRWYSFYREKFSKAQSLNQKGQNNSNYGSCWIINLQTGDIKRIKKIELQTFLEKGYVRGRTLNDRYRMTQGKYKKLSTQQKELNKIKRINKQKETLKQKEPQVCYLNKETGVRKYFSKTDKPNLTIWEPTWSKFDIQKIKQFLQDKKTWNYIANYYNTTYWSIYSWYRDNKNLFKD